MREQDKLNLPALNELFQTSPWRSVFKVGFKAGKGAEAGLAATGFVISLLITVGISVAAVYEIIAATTAGVLFLLMGGGITIYRVMKEQAAIKEAKAKFDAKLTLLKRNILELLLNYYELEQARAKLTQQFTHQEDAQEVQEAVQRIDAAKHSLLDDIKVSLSVVAGGNNLEKLMTIFSHGSEVANEQAIIDYARQEIGIHPVIASIASGLDAAGGHINTPLAGANLNERQARLNEVMPRPREREHERPGFTYFATFVGGFFLGLGLSVPVATMIVGGAAAMLAVGWPVFAPILAASLITGALALTYYHFVKKRQEKTDLKLRFADTQVTGVTAYLKHSNNDAEKTLVYAKGKKAQLLNKSSVRIDKLHHEAEIKQANLEAQRRQAVREIDIRFEGPEGDVKRYEKMILDHKAAISSLNNEIKIGMNKASTAIHELHKGNDLFKSVTAMGALLDDLQQRVNAISEPEERKRELLQKIDALKTLEEENLRNSREIQHRIDTKAHQVLERKAANEVPHPHTPGMIEQATAIDAKVEEQPRQEQENHS